MLKKTFSIFKKRNNNSTDINFGFNAGENLDELNQVLNNKKIYDISDFNEEDIKRILLNLNCDEALHFFDYFHPQWSDPGAYVTVEKYNEKYTYMLGNHGWSSYWHLSDIDRISRYIYKNRGYQEDTVYIRKMNNSQRQLDNIQIEKLWIEKLTLVYVDENKDEIYEVNGYHIVNLVKLEKAIIIEETFEEKIERKEYRYIFEHYYDNYELYSDREVILKFRT